MAVQRSHGRLFPVVLPPNELPEGQAAPAEPVERRSGGQVVAGESARRLGQRGGRAAARRRKDLAGYAASFGLGRLLSKLNDESLLAEYVSEGERWLEAQIAAVARDVGGGQLSPGVVSILRGAAWSRLFSAYFFTLATKSAFAWLVEEGPAAEGDGKSKRPVPRAELVLVAERLASSSRQALLAGHELAAREAAARKLAGPANPHEALFAAAAEDEAERRAKEGGGG